MKIGLALFALVAGSTAALAQPTITALGGGVPVSVTNNTGGTVLVGGSNGPATRWVLTGSSLSVFTTGATGGGGEISSNGLYQVGQFANTGPQIFGNTATGVTPTFNPNPTLVPSTTQPAATEFAARRITIADGSVTNPGGLPIVPSLLAYGSSSSGGSTGNFMNGLGISSNGQFIVGQGYVCTYNNAGNAVSANSFRWRPWIWNAAGNGGAGEMILLPTPLRTSSNTSLYRTGIAYDVSSDGSVVLGAQEHNVGGTGGDSANLAVWRFNIGTGQYEFSPLPGGNAGSSTDSGVAMNDAGTIIVGRGTDGTTSFLAKWTWDGSAWQGPENLGSNLSTPASWLPGSVTSCGQPPNITSSLVMNEDASVIAGAATYSTCGSFMSGGWIRYELNGEFVIEDWYDYNAARNVPGVSVGGFFGPTGDQGDPSKGLPVLGFPTAISPDGTIIAGFQGGTARIPGAPAWVMQDTGGAPCVAPSITLNPNATVTFDACTSSAIFNVGAAGTAPFTYQWFKDGVALTNGGQPGGSTITGADSFQMRINAPVTSADIGTYYAVVTGQCGTPAESASASLEQNSAFPPIANDTCSTATVVSMGTNVLGTGQAPCGAYVNDSGLTSSCALNTKNDMWYEFTPSVSGNYRLETCGGTFDSVLSIFDGCSGSELDCNDNYTSGPTTGCSSQRSRLLSVALNAGTAYKIRISATSGAFLFSGSLANLSITDAPAPASNDFCASATPAPVGVTPFSQVEATNDTVVSCNTALSRDVWFVHTPTASGVTSFSTCGTTLNTVMTLFNDCVSGIEIGCNDNSGLSGCTQQAVISNVNTTAGVPVYVRIASNSATTVGTGNLTITNVGCDSIDFNNDGLFPDEADLIDFLNVSAGGACSTGNCGDTDFNNDGLFPDDNDLIAFLTIQAGGNC